MSLTTVSFMIGRLFSPRLPPRTAIALCAGTMLLLAAPGWADDVRPAAETAAEYVIRPGDILQLVVWKEPDLTRDVTVRLDGRITVPLLGDVDAAGRTPAQLGGDLGKGLTRYVAAPVVTVGVSQANSSKVYVLGQVVQPGAFPLTSRMTVLQALALAGGFKEFAKTERIVVIREAAPKAPITMNYKRVEAGDDLGQNVMLLPGDTIVVP
jgi:polysaccharide biosynthesis/export protein